MPPKNRTSVLMTLPPEFTRATAMPINPCTGAPGATPHWTCIAANPPGHASPPGTHGTGGKRSLPAGRPVRPVYQSDQIRTREGYRGRSRARRADGSRPLYPAGGLAGPAGALGRNVQRVELRVPARPLGASGGERGAGVDCVGPPHCGGSRHREIFRPGQPRHPDGAFGQTGGRSAHPEARPRVPDLRRAGGRAGRADRRRNPARRPAVEPDARRAGQGTRATRPPFRALRRRLQHLRVQSACGRAGDGERRALPRTAVEAHVAALDDAVDAVREITGSDDISMMGSWSGGITSAAYLATLGLAKIKNLILFVCLLDTATASDSAFGSLVTPETMIAAKEASRLRGVLDGQDLARMFAWMRPNGQQLPARQRPAGLRHPLLERRYDPATGAPPRRLHQSLFHQPVRQRRQIDPEREDGRHGPSEGLRSRHACPVDAYTPQG